MGRKGDRVFGILDNVDFFAAQLADDGLHAHALHSDAGAHAVDIAVAAHDGDLGAFAGLPGAAVDDHRIVVDFRNFLLEQTHHELGRGARDDDTGVLAGFFDASDDASNAIAGAEIFELALFFLGQPRLGFAEVDHQVLRFDTLDGAVDQLPDAPGIFGIDGLALGFAHLLQDHLFGGLGRDAPQCVGGLGKTDFAFQLGRRIDAVGVFKRDFLVRVLNGFDDFFDAVNFERTGFVECGDQVFGSVEMLARRDEHGIFHRVNDDLRIDALLFAQDFNGLIDATHCVLSIKLSGGEFTTQTSGWLFRPA